MTRCVSHSDICVTLRNGPVHVIRARSTARATADVDAPAPRPRTGSRNFASSVAASVGADAADWMDDDDDSDSSSIALECALETMLDPTLAGDVSKASTIELLSAMSARELCRTSDACACARGCRFKKYVDCDELWWPKCAEAWYEPGEAPRCPGKAPKDKKSWKNAYLALRPEDGPTPAEMARREAKIAKREALMEKWREENAAGIGAMRGRAIGVGDVTAPTNMSDKAAMRAFYKSVRAKPRGKSARGSHAPVPGPFTED